MNNLRNIRKDRGVSIAKLHKLTGIPVRTLEDWDSEKSLLQSYHRMKNISEALGCDIDELMTKVENCIYDGKKAALFLYQNENGVDISVYDEEIECCFSTTIPRVKAMELLKYRKINEDITSFLSDIN